MLTDFDAEDWQLLFLDQQHDLLYAVVGWHVELCYYDAVMRRRMRRCDRADDKTS